MRAASLMLFFDATNSKPKDNAETQLVRGYFE
jgi:hypothetical protein